MKQNVATEGVGSLPHISVHSVGFGSSWCTAAIFELCAVIKALTLPPTDYWAIEPFDSAAVGSEVPRIDLGCQNVMHHMTLDGNTCSRLLSRPILRNSLVGIVLFE